MTRSRATAVSRSPRYKRNQIEEAIVRLDGRDAGTLRTRLKRLLDTDRRLEGDTDSHEAESAQFAFFDEAPPGSGAEIQYTDYEAFALFVGLRFLSVGFPQATVVKLLRGGRRQLEQNYRLFRNSGMPAEGRKGARPPGSLPIEGPIIVVFHAIDRKVPEGESMRLMMFESLVDVYPERAKNHPSEAMTILEWQELARALDAALAETTPLRRGRPSR